MEERNMAREKSTKTENVFMNKELRIRGIAKIVEMAIFSTCK